MKRLYAILALLFVLSVSCGSTPKSPELVRADSRAIVLVVAQGVRDASVLCVQAGRAIAGSGNVEGGKKLILSCRDILVPVAEATDLAAEAVDAWSAATDATSMEQKIACLGAYAIDAWAKVLLALKTAGVNTSPEVQDAWLFVSKFAAPLASCAALSPPPPLPAPAPGVAL